MHVCVNTLTRASRQLSHIMHVSQWAYEWVLSSWAHPWEGFVPCLSLCKGVHMLCCQAISVPVVEEDVRTRSNLLSLQHRGCKRALGNHNGADFFHYQGALSASAWQITWCYHLQIDQVKGLIRNRMACQIEMWCVQGALSTGAVAWFRAHLQRHIPCLIVWWSSTAEHLDKEKNKR